MNVKAWGLSTLGANDRVLAYANLMLDDWLAIHDLKIIRRDEGGLFVAMPNKMGKDGEWHDIAHPINQEGRELIERVVLDAYADYTHQYKRTYMTKEANAIVKLFGGREPRVSDSP